MPPFLVTKDHPAWTTALHPPGDVPFPAGVRWRNPARVAFLLTVLRGSVVHAQDGYVFSTFAGRAGASGSSDGSVASARFSSPKGVAQGWDGSILVVDSDNFTIRRIASGGVTTIAGQTASVAANDDWAGDPARSAAFVARGAFPFAGPAASDAALLVTLEPGAYSAQVSGVGGTTGEALVEIYEVP